MPKPRVAIIGTGLIGTSIGLGLMARKDRPYEVVGTDRERANARTAKKMGALDRDTGSLADAVSEAGLVILAVPVMAARQLLQELGPELADGCVIMDTCSTKVDIMHWAGEFLPDTVNFVGTHPMAGREVSGPGGASADLFRTATWAVTPSAKAAEEAISVVLGIIEALGAAPLYIDPAEHDQYAAAVSHLPLLVSVALFRMVRDSQGWEDASILAGPAFRDLTRLASGSPAMSRDIMTTNRDAVLHWIGRFQAELDTIQQAIEGGGPAVNDLFESTQFDRDTFMANPPQRRRLEGPTPPSSQDTIGRLFVGGAYDKIKEITSRAPTRVDDSELRRKLGAPNDDR